MADRLTVLIPPNVTRKPRAPREGRLPFRRPDIFLGQMRSWLVRSSSLLQRQIGDRYTTAW
jgi:hypothetical protein